MMSQVVNQPVQGVDSSSADKERSSLVLPAYKDTRIDYVAGDDFGKTVIWIRDAFVYSHHGETSLSFLFAKKHSKTRFTARISDRLSVWGLEDNPALMYCVNFPVKIGGASLVLDVLLCETADVDAPAIVSHQDLFLFSSPRRN